MASRPSTCREEKTCRKKVILTGFGPRGLAQLDAIEAILGGSFGHWMGKYLVGGFYELPGNHPLDGAGDVSLSARSVRVSPPFPEISQLPATCTSDYLDLVKAIIHSLRMDP